MAGLGGLTCLAFAMTQPLSAALFTLIAIGLVSFACAVQAWRKAPEGLLRWDGQHWHWTALDAEQACQLTPVVDLQSLMLVRIHSATGNKAWIWLEASPGGGNWIALRRAVFGSQRAQNTTRKSTNAEASLQDEDFA
jgi:toxin CptA